MTVRGIAALFSSLELRLIQSLKRNLARHIAWEKDEGFQWPAWQALKLQEVERFRKQNKAILEEYAPLIDRETRDLMREQFLEGQRRADADIAELGYTPLSDSSFFGLDEPRLEALIEDIQKSERMAETSTFRVMDDVYRKTILEAETALSTGAVTLPQAVDMATKRFLAAGINSIQYSNGRMVNIASYAEMALRTAATRSYLRGAAQRRSQYGVDTVLVSQYGACSQTCLPWQGRVYIDDVWGDFEGEISGDRGQSVNDNWYPLLSVAIRGGLFHPNCRHSLTTWIEGISRMPEPLDPKKIAENSKLEARQREMEREVRKWKRMEEGSLNPVSVEAYGRKAREAQKTLRTFIRGHDNVLRRDPWREDTLGVSFTADQETVILTREIKHEAGIRGLLHLTPTPIDVGSLSFDETHINAERMHGVSVTEAKEFIRSASVSVSVWNGKYERYYSQQGVSYVERNKQHIRTAYKPEEFREDVIRILEVLKKYGII